MIYGISTFTPAYNGDVADDGNAIALLVSYQIANGTPGNLGVDHPTSSNLAVDPFPDGTLRSQSRREYCIN